LVMDALSRAVEERGDSVCKYGTAVGSSMAVPGLDHSPLFGPDIMDRNHRITILARDKHHPHQCPIRSRNDDNPSAA
jgi:hypothetical protein